MIIIFLAVVESILLFFHWFLYKTIIKFLIITSPSAILSLRWTIGILSISFVLSSLLTFRYYNIATRIFYTLAAGWLGIFYFLLIACTVIWLVSLLPVNHRLAAQVIFSLSALLGIYALVNAGSVRVTDVTARLPRLPSAWQGKTAVWVSDVHLGQIRNQGFSQKLSGMINNLHPDVVFIGGDLYDGVAVDANKAIEPFSRLNPPFGTYFITGNHEEFRDDKIYLDAIKKAGITDLDNKKVDLNGLQIVGVDYRSSTQPNTYKKTLADLKIDPAKPSILLKHVPSNLQIADEAGISFQISGHTHKAQVWPFTYIAKSVYKGYDYGLKTFSNMQVLTSSGAGTWGPPVRFLTKAEIVRIRFE